jgi:hypothetical protein
VQDGDVVLVEQSSDTRVMPATKGFTEWAQETYFPEALPYFVDFPKGWRQLPRVYTVWKGCPYEDLNEARKLHTGWNPSLWPTIRSGNFIYLRVENGRLERISDWVTIEGRSFRPKADPDQSLAPLKLSKIYLNLTSPVDSGDWFTLRNAKSYPR